MGHPDYSKFAKLGKKYKTKMAKERKSWLKDAASIKTTFLRASHPEIYSLLMKHTTSKLNLKKAELFTFLFPEASRHCKHCGEHTAYDAHIHQFKPWCSSKCLYDSGHVVNTVKGIWSKRTDKEKQSIVRKTWKTRLADPKKHREAYEKKVATCIARYGVEHPVVLPNVCHKFKVYTDKNGIEHKVQGYEDKALALIESKSRVQSIVSQKSKIRKLFPIQYDGDKIYYPDLIVKVKGDLRVVEVKSDYYLIKDLDKNIKKFHQCSKAIQQSRGRSFWLFLYERYGKFCAIIKNPTNKSDIKRKLKKQGYRIKDNRLVKL